MNKAILYNGVWLMRGSEAYELLINPPQGAKSTSPKNIQSHMKEVEARELKMHGVIYRHRWNIGQGFVELK